MTSPLTPFSYTYYHFSSTHNILGNSDMNEVRSKTFQKNYCRAWGTGVKPITIKWHVVEVLRRNLAPFFTELGSVRYPFQNATRFQNSLGNMLPRTVLSPVNLTLTSHLDAMELRRGGELFATSSGATLIFEVTRVFLCHRVPHKSSSFMMSSTEYVVALSKKRTAERDDGFPFTSYIEIFKEGGR